MYNMQYNYCQAGEMPYKTLPDALDLIKKAVQGEKNDELFYDYLISLAPSREEVDIISGIRDDEKKHNKMFREIYSYFTGQELSPESNEEIEKPASYIEGIRKALLGELAAMERYRDIRAGIPTRYYKDMVFEILMDELKHADLYNYILNINLVTEGLINATQYKSLQQNQADIPENKEQFTPDDMVIYITPLVNQALKEVNEGINLEHLFQEYILAGILVGSGFSTEEAIHEVEMWEKTGASKLLQESKSKK